jgi:hypothetical protein
VFWLRDIRRKPHARPRCGEDIIKIKFSRGVTGRHELVFSGLGYGQVEGICECGNELSVSIKCWQFLD